MHTAAHSLKFKTSNSTQTQTETRTPQRNKEPYSCNNFTCQEAHSTKASGADASATTSQCHPKAGVRFVPANGYAPPAGNEACAMPWLRCTPTKRNMPGHRAHLLLQPVDNNWSVQLRPTTAAAQLGDAL